TSDATIRGAVAAHVRSRLGRYRPLRVAASLPDLPHSRSAQGVGERADRSRIRLGRELPSAASRGAAGAPPRDGDARSALRFASAGDASAPVDRRAGPPQTRARRARAASPHDVMRGFLQVLAASLMLAMPATAQDSVRAPTPPKPVPFNVGERLEYQV